MKTRILCVILSLIMLVSLVPAAAINASAAGRSTSADAVLVLKQLEGYSKYCTNGYTGYGTLCTKEGDHAGHVTSEKEASDALDKELKVLDQAVSSFASRNGLSLSQGQHDALVLFSFENGTAWTTGTGDFQNAVKSGAQGEEFLNAICLWDSSIADDYRRVIEANMYLNGIYSSSAPSRYIRVQFDADGGKMTGGEYQYFDVASTRTLDLAAHKDYSYFMGWYSGKTDGERVYTLTTSHHTKTLYARYQSYDTDPGFDDFHEKANPVSYTITRANLLSSIVYDVPNGDQNDYQVGMTMKVDMEYVDGNGYMWCHIYDEDYVEEGIYQKWDRGWVVVGKASEINGFANNGLKYDIDVTVTVTNTYLRVRAEATLYSKELRQAQMGEQLRIVNTESRDGFLWGQIADADNDGVCEGWVALMYTNFEEVRDQGNTSASTNVIGRATIIKPVDGYVNVRSDAGTDNEIVGALPYKSVVEIYEITYVNGIKWARYSGGWFCLSYAQVEGVDLNNYVASNGVLSYAFTGTLQDTWAIFEAPGSDVTIRVKEAVDTNVTVTNLTAVDDGSTWGKIPEGWVKVTNADYTPANVKLNIAKFYTIVDGVTVRKDHPGTDSERVNNLTKGVEFNVNEKYQVIVLGDTIWGYADKVGEGERTYSGWVNLASKYVARGDAPSISTNTNAPTGYLGTIVGADQVNVRITHSIHSKSLGKIPRGTTVAILGQDEDWYMLDYDVDNDPSTDSWVNAQYVEVTKAPVEEDNGTNGTGSNSSGSVETGLGVVANTYSGVNVRTGPGTGYAQTGKLLPGTTVEVMEVTTGGNTKWGRVKEGWVCMDYVTMIDNYDVLGSQNNAGGSTVTGSEVAIYTGKINATSAAVHKVTNEDSDVVRTLNWNSPVTVHEIMTVIREIETTISETKTQIEKITEYWARVNDGYIFLEDTDHDGVVNNLLLDTLDEAVYTITESETLNVRSNAGTGHAIEFKLTKGDQVVVTKVTIVNGSVWGFIEADATETFITDEEGKKTTEYNWDGDGWISLAYCTKGAITIQTETPPAQNTPTGPVIGAGSDNGGYVNNNSGYRYTGKVINTNSLNVRAQASDTAQIVTTLNNGASLVIYETYNDGIYAWGRCDAGWVYLYYVDLTPVVNGAVDARVVFNNNTIVYKDMNCTEVAGTYAKMSVVDIYEVVGKMARTDLGWVNVDNLL